MSDNKSERPFTRAYVMYVTTWHMLNSVEHSIRKTFARIGEFDGQREKSEEVFQTLVALHQWQSILLKYQREIESQRKQDESQEHGGQEANQEN